MPGNNVGNQQPAPQQGEGVAESQIDSAEVEKKLEDLYANRGKKTYQVVLAEIDNDSLKKAVQGYTMDAMEEWDKNHVKKGIKKILPSNTIARAMRLSQYKKVANRAAKESGSVDAISLAIQEMQKQEQAADFKVTHFKKGDADNIIDTVKNRLDDENDEVNRDNGAHRMDSNIFDRATMAAEAGEENLDLGVKKNDEDTERQSEIRDAFTQYAQEVATYKGGKKTKAVKEARKELETRLDEIGGAVAASNYSDTIDKMSEDLKGAFAGELKKGADKHEHDVAIAAIDKYIQDNLNVFDAKVEFGLDAKEAKFKTLGDRATYTYGAAIGATIALVGSTVNAIGKSTLARAVSNSAIVAAGVRIALATGLGAAKGAVDEHNKQLRENVKDALSGESKEKKKGHFEIMNVDEKISEMKDLIDKGIATEADYSNAMKIVNQLRARNSIQNEKHIQLLGYNSRDDIEQSKCEMFKTINQLTKLAKASGFGSETDEMVALQEKSDVYKMVGDVKKDQRWAVLGKAVKTGAIALGAAALGTAIGDAVGGLAHGKGLLGGKIGSELKGLADGSLKWDGLHIVEATGAATAAAETVTAAGEAEATREVLDKGSGAVLINDDPAGGVEVGLDKDGDGVIDTYLFGEGDQPGIDLSDESQIAELNESLNQYGIELQHEQIISSEYGQVSIESYLNNAENAVNVGPVDWGQSSTRVVFGNPVAVAADGMDQYEVNIAALNGGEIPEGAKFFIDLDGDGPGSALEYTIQDGKAIIPADVLDTSRVGSGGVANFIGVARVGEVNAEGNMVSYATSFGKAANLSDTLTASIDNDVHAFTAIDVETGERLSQFAVNPESAEISNMSEIFNGIEVSGHDRLPSVFTVNDLGDNAQPVTLASGQVLQDYDVSGGYHPEFDAFENTPFKGSDTFLGTPMTWDADMDGVMSPEEELSYIKQLIVRTGTNPYMLGQNASNYGILEPETLENIIPREKLVEWGITDGVVDSETELNLMLAALKQPANAEYWDSLANATINEMESKLSNGGFDVERIAERTATYSNSLGLFDTSGATTQRTILYPYTINENGEKVAIGNVGWWCRKYGAYGGRVGDLPLCEQKGIPRGSEGSESSEGIENTGSENSETSETSETSEGVEDTGSENSETTETSEGIEDTGSEDSETSEGIEDTGSEDSETSEGVEDTGSEGTEGSEGNEDIKNATAIEQNMGVHDETTNVLDQRGVTEQTDIPTFAPEGVNVDTTNAADNAAQEAADAAAREVGETPIYSNEELGQLYEQFRVNQGQ